MFYYFGYGSNINLIALRAKGVEPFFSMRAVLEGWCLKFNVKHWFRHEGGVGNIERSNVPGDRVEGMVHYCTDDDLAKLDAMEAFGKGYDRIEVEIATQNGKQKALAYVGMPAALDDSCLPSRRYLNILLNGAKAAGLSKEYIEKLRQHPILEMPDYPKFLYPAGNGITFNEETLAQNPKLTALSGVVFDMSGARSELESAADLFGGRDMTLFHLKRLDSSDGSETLEDVISGRISEEGKKYLNAYLHEYAREFKYAGRYIYDGA